MMFRHHSEPATSPSSSSAQHDEELPSQTFHPSLVPRPGGLLGSAAGGTHYSGAKVHHRRSDIQRASGSIDSSDLGEQRKQVLKDLQELYLCRPTVEMFERSWRKDAVFEDPLTACNGLQEIAPQWYAMTKVFSRSETLSHKILTSTHNPNRIIISQTQQYTLKLIGVKRTFKSIILIELDDEEKIVRVEDQWNGEEVSSTGVIGWVRRMNGKVTPWLVSIPKELRGSKSI